MSDKYVELVDFLKNKMRMSHVYQPVMLIELLRSNGVSCVTDVAKALLSYDVSQIEYYESITKNMVGNVLTRRRGLTDKVGNEYRLKGFSDLTEAEVQDLICICENKIRGFIEQRGDDAWSHRKKSVGYISGTLRYEILKREKFRCELCGISAEKKALEIDHIIPRVKGGSDDQSNLQSLCYSCNSMKRDRDDEDLRGVSDSYSHREQGCIFCEIPKNRVIAENELAYAIRDGYPVTDLHTLVIPKRHVIDYFDLYQPERNAIQQLLELQRGLIISKDRTVEGFNVGNNSGQAAGQTVMHCHTHLIPRRKGDSDNPKGGVRGVIPSKQSY
jgi:diadenosine tetraphosphate (Ap4A) HIT family hydrolase